MKEKSTSLNHEYLVEQVKEIQAVGVKEKKLTLGQRLVIATIRDLVVHLIEGKSFEESYQMAESVGQVTEGTKVMLGVNGWLRTFNLEENFYFSSEDLECELTQIAGRDTDKGMTHFQSLSSKWRLTGLREKDMNGKEGMTGQERIVLLQQALISGKLGIKFFNEQILSCGSGLGPVITGKKL
ncbi:hypothetical protein A3I57_00020 [Candidatus Beckwithbacteria bacterium RIFCSPLOWO2_02_FULL_47_23]|uniref:Uncharacterized protein n=2 Tax=Candidatus Beckwithiibacteriota TaxID=1752726 RepID=A0A1F5DSR1_9BACT|nr:MAG: hypothetical protein A3E73_00900 [Candidatus Beckwithbacteria bacterium RIFCSPHIGHO2_12_FULL_47_17]OGD58219.1 MAG: hypothetical protein A3I57_00020 [Candidatus Beckwithbacteria bacterium RIFCSPLOWO2_02_FULL_47_23]